MFTEICLSIICSSNVSLYSYISYIYVKCFIISTQIHRQHSYIKRLINANKLPQTKLTFPLQCISNVMYCTVQYIVYASIQIYKRRRTWELYQLPPSPKWNNSCVFWKENRSEPDKEYFWLTRLSQSYSLTIRKIAVYL